MLLFPLSNFIRSSAISPEGMANSVFPSVTVIPFVVMIVGVRRWLDLFSTDVVNVLDAFYCITVLIAVLAIRYGYALNTAFIVVFSISESSTSALSNVPVKW